MDRFPEVGRVWEKMLRISTVMKSLEKCTEGGESTDRIYGKLKTLHNELTEDLNGLYKWLSTLKQNQALLMELVNSQRSLTAAASALEKKIFSADDGNASVGTSNSQIPRPLNKEVIHTDSSSILSTDKSSALNPNSFGWNGIGMILATEEELNSVPGYLRGRITLAQVNDCITKINSAMQKKYEIIKKPRNALKMSEKLMKDAFRKQETPAVKGMYFFTMDNLKDFSDFKMTSVNTTVFKILRHIRRMKEIREAREPIRYTLIL